MQADLWEVNWKEAQGAELLVAWTKSNRQSSLPKHKE
jgi:hypothetical protein